MQEGHTDWSITYLWGVAMKTTFSVLFNKSLYLICSCPIANICFIIRPPREWPTHMILLPLPADQSTNKRILHINLIREYDRYNWLPMSCLLIFYWQTTPKSFRDLCKEFAFCVCLFNPFDTLLSLPNRWAIDKQLRTWFSRHILTLLMSYLFKLYLWATQHLQFL